jgi:heat shock protein HslJ
MKTLNVKRTLLLSVLVILGLIVTGCLAPLPAPEEAAGTESAMDSDAVALEGTLWRLESHVDASGATVAALPETEVTALFEGGDVGGSAGCNQYFGTYKVDGNALSVALGGLTMMACEPSVSDQENQYVVNLNSAATYMIEGKTLQIADGSGEIVLTYSVFESAPLVDTAWRLLRYDNGRGGLTSDLTSELITAVFSADGTVSGFAGCNSYSASYSVDGDSIEIGPAISTQKACSEPEGVMETEFAYLTALQTAVTFESVANELTLRNADGTPAVAYQVDDVEPLALVGPNWLLLQYNNGKGGLVSDLTSELITATFSEDGTVSGFSGCNNYSAGYVVDGDSIQFGPAMANMMACSEPQGVMEAEAAYLAALSTATTFELDAEELTLRNGEGTVALKYRAETP